jgi:indole-3-glycerol phosphate synthase
MSDVLAQIYRARLARLEEEISSEPLAVLEERAASRTGTRRSLWAALNRARPPGLIAEIKRASPSAGLITDDFDVARIAASYQLAGADAISVLTEEDHFQGRLSYLGIVRQETSVPLLRKDFLTTPYEVVQSAAYGADAILAIVAGLTDPQLLALLETSLAWDIEVLVEVHSEAEIERALRLGATLLGINNRDLRTLATNTEVSRRLISLIPPGILVVGESGYESTDEIQSAHRGGIPTFLVGEALMRTDDKVAFVSAVKAAGNVGA